MPSIIKGPNSWRMNGMIPEGEPAIVTYGFHANASSALKSGMRSAVDHASDVAGLIFQEIPVGADPMIEVRLWPAGEGWSQARYPSVSPSAPDADATIEMYVADTYAPGSWGREILLHELGHTLGLKHPPAGISTDRTLMSYERTSPHTTYQEIDVATLTELYGTSVEDDISVRWMPSADRVIIKDIVGQSGTLIGVNNDTVIYGRAGDDLIIGREGDDTLLGHQGDDTLRGGPGRDVLAGGAGADVFEVDARDVITDFNAGEGDVIVNAAPPPDDWLIS